ncbi:MAG: restriction endonuclease subunit S [Bacteroidales bacterium]|nr:restriction endonuclease subunit S [Bacteroidales bacterium]
MEGLEISEVMLSKLKIGNNNLRIDAEYFRKEYLNEDSQLIKIGVVELGDYAFITDGQHGYYESDLTSNIHMLAARNCKDYFANTIDALQLAKWVDDNNKRSSLQNGDIVLSTRGSVGSCAIVYDEVLPANINQDVARIKLNDRDTFIPEFLITYLNCIYGQNWMLRNQSGMVQQGLPLDKVRSIPLPLLPLPFQHKIEQIVKSAHTNLFRSKSFYSEAENILLSELGLKDWQPNNAPVNIKQLKESFLASGRLDAEYYQTKYEDYAGFIRKYKHGFDVLGNVCSLNEKNFNPLDNTEYRYIELSNIGNSGEITGYTTSIGAELPSRARRLVHTNDVIVSSIEGSLQSVALVTAEYDKAICSTGFYVVKSETINPETLLVLFKSEPMQNLLKQGCSGTILTAIGRNELQNIVMPKIRNEVQKEIAEYVQKSISLRNEAKQLLENAKLQVEDAIFTPPIWLRIN